MNDRERGKRVGVSSITYTSEQAKTVIHFYVEEGRGKNFCAKKAGCTVRAVSKILEDNNIKIRDRKEANALSGDRIVTLNKGYFSVQSHNMAWMLGFLAVDGTIRKGENEIKIGLSIKDKEILEKIKNEIGTDRKVKEYTTSNGFDCCQLTWTCQQHKKDLAKYNIVPAKTFILTPPYKLEEKYYLDYIRGYFDGDGSVSQIGKDKRYYRWRLCSATKKILEFTIDVFEKYGIPPVKIHSSSNGKNILYEIEYATASSKKIYNLLYQNPNTLFLARKKNRFEELIKQANE